MEYHCDGCEEKFSANKIINIGERFLCKECWKEEFKSEK